MYKWNQIYLAYDLFAAVICTSAARSRRVKWKAKGDWWCFGKMISFFHSYSCAQFFNLDDWIYTTFFCLLMLYIHFVSIILNIYYILVDMFKSNQCMFGYMSNGQHDYMCFSSKHWIYLCIYVRDWVNLLFITPSSNLKCRICVERIRVSCGFCGRQHCRYIENLESEAFN